METWLSFMTRSEHEKKPASLGLRAFCKIYEANQVGRIQVFKVRSTAALQQDKLRGNPGCQFMSTRVIKSTASITRRLPHRKFRGRETGPMPMPTSSHAVKLVAPEKRLWKSRAFSASTQRRLLSCHQTNPRIGGLPHQSDQVGSCDRGNVAHGFDIASAN